MDPSKLPSMDPSKLPSKDPSKLPSMDPSKLPSMFPSKDSVPLASCCSRKFKSCDVHHCGDTESSCLACYNVAWIAPPPTESTCLARYVKCNEGTCCPGLTCDGSIYHSQCKYL